MDELLIKQVIGGYVLSTPRTEDEIFTESADILNCVRNFLKKNETDSGETMPRGEAEMQS